MAQTLMDSRYTGLLLTNQTMAARALVPRSMISYLSFWVGQGHLDVLASAPGALVLPDEVSGRAGAHTCVRCPDLQQTALHLKS